MSSFVFKGCNYLSFSKAVLILIRVKRSYSSKIYLGISGLYVNKHLHDIFLGYLKSSQSLNILLDLVFRREDKWGDSGLVNNFSDQHLNIFFTYNYLL